MSLLLKGAGWETEVWRGEEKRGGGEQRQMMEERIYGQKQRERGGRGRKRE